MTWVCGCGTVADEDQTDTRLRVGGWRLLDAVSPSGKRVKDATCPTCNRSHRLPKTPVLEGQLPMFEWKE